MMLLRIILTSLLIALLGNPKTVMAIDTTSIPVIDKLLKKSTFSISLNNNDSLKEILINEITYQRKNNTQLKLLTKKHKFSRIESGILKSRLRAEGYYDAQIKSTISENHIAYQVESGTQYRIKNLFFIQPKDIKVDTQLLALNVGDTLKAEKILTARTLLRDFVSTHYCLYDTLVDYKVVADKATHSADITFTIAESPSVNFGRIQFEGIHSIDIDYLKGRIPMKEGGCFKRQLIDQSRINLIQTNLLSSLSATTHQVQNGSVPITLIATERFHKSIGAGLGYQTDQGPGLSIDWEHRNLMRKAQRLKLNIQVSEDTQKLSADFSVPNFLKDNRILTAYSDIIHTESDAYESQTTNIGFGLIQQISPKVRTTIGTEFSLLNLPREIENPNRTLVSIPISINFDKRNDPITPQQGWVIGGYLSPYKDISDSTSEFLKSTISASAYLTAKHPSWQPTIAVRGSIGTIDGGNKEIIPKNILFYVGGGGSVRGYPYQSLGPLEDNVPTGGLSFSEASIETRFRWGKNWGGALFLDSGMAYQESTPRIGEHLHWGIGFGLRYYTSFTPIRFDFAVPMDKRSGVDDNFQIYINLGPEF